MDSIGFGGERDKSGKLGARPGAECRSHMCDLDWKVVMTKARNRVEAPGRSHKFYPKAVLL
jgi:hypothetical protein